MATKKLIVTVIEARNVKPNTTPFVRVKGPTHKFTTRNSLSKTGIVWNEEFTIDIDISKDPKGIIFRVYHQGPLKRVFLGCTQVLLKDENAFQEEGNWYNLVAMPEKKKKFGSSISKPPAQKEEYGDLRVRFKWRDLTQMTTTRSTTPLRIFQGSQRTPSPSPKAPPPGLHQRSLYMSGTGASQPNLPTTTSSSPAPSRLAQEAPEKPIDQGALVVKVIQAKSLPAVEKDGTADPYVKIKIGDDYLKTNTVFANVNPTWNETLYFKVGGGLPPQIIFEVKHDNLLIQNKPLGTVVVPTTDLKPEIPVENWYPLDGKMGMLRVSVEYQPLAIAKNNKKNTLALFLSKASNKYNHVSSDATIVVKIPTRLLVRASMVIRDRIKERGYQGSVVTMLGVLFVKLGWTLKTKDSTSTNRKEMTLDPEEKKHHGALAKLLGWASDKVIDMIQIMCRQVKEMGYSGKCGARISVGYLYPSSNPNEPGTPLNFMIGLTVKSDSVPLDPQPPTIQTIEKIVYKEDEKKLAEAQNKSQTQTPQGPQTPPPPPKGGLVVKLNGVTNLRETAQSYAVLTVNNQVKQSSVTTTATKNPVWQEGFTFSAPGKPPAFIEVYIKQHRPANQMSGSQKNQIMSKISNFLTQDSLGTCRIPTAQLQPRYPCEFQAELLPTYMGSRVSLVAEYVPDLDTTRGQADPNQVAVNIKQGSATKTIRLATRGMVYATLFMRQRALERNFSGQVYSTYAVPFFSLGLSVSTEETEEEIKKRVQKAEAAADQYGDDEITEEEYRAVERLVRNACAAVIDKILDFIGLGALELQRQNCQGVITVGNTVQTPILAFTIGFKIEGDGVPREEDRIEAIDDLITEPVDSVAESADDEKPVPESGPPGALIITIVQAKNLTAVDKNKTTSNPYVIIKVGSNRLKSSIQMENLNPIFNDTLVFPCPEGVPESLDLEVKHDNFIGGNTTLGKVQVYLPPDLGLTGEEDWVPLDGECGYVRIVMKYDPNKVVAPIAEKTLIEGLQTKASRKIGIMSKQTVKSSISAGFRVVILASKLLLRRMRQRELNCNGISMLTLFMTTLGVTVSTKPSKAYKKLQEKAKENDESAFETEEEKEKDGAVVNCINSLIDKLLEALLIASIEVQRLGTKGKLKVMVIGGLPPPYPSWFSLSLALELKTDSVQNVNDQNFSITDERFTKIPSK